MWQSRVILEVLQMNEFPRRKCLSPEVGAHSVMCGTSDYSRMSSIFCVKMCSLSGSSTVKTMQDQNNILNIVNGDYATDMFPIEEDLEGSTRVKNKGKICTCPLSD